jgi:hypothetical protein
VKYQFTPDCGAPLGRIELPAFLVSDFRKVGYADPWVRPQVVVCGLAPLTNNDGVDASYRVLLGDVTNTLRGAYGRSYKLRFPDDVGIDTENLCGVFDSAEYGAALFHPSYVEGRATQKSGIALFGVLRGLGPLGAAIADRYELVNKPVSVMAFGAS